MTQRKSPEISRLNEIPKIDTGREIEELNDDVLGKITNREFLNVNKAERLKHVTEPSVKSQDLVEGGNIAIKFRFGGKLNLDLYQKTTIGQLLPSNIREVAAHGTNWTRSGSEGEFLTQTGQRLIIRDGTSVSIKKMLSEPEILAEQERVIDSIKTYREDSSYDIFLEGSKRNIDINVIKNLIIPQITETDGKKRKVQIEEILTEFERVKDYYSDDFGSNSIIEGGKLSNKFLAYYINQSSIGGELKATAIQELGISREDISNFDRKKRSIVFRGFRGMEELSDAERTSLSEVSTGLLEKWKTEQFGMQIVPGSKEAMQLFTVACLMMKPQLSVEEAKSWGTHEGLHYILKHESDGIVGRENYTLKHAGISGKEMKERSINKGNLEGNQLASKEFGVISTAVGLGQLTMSNEQYLPNGRNSIGVPLEEAVGMLQYIRDRYGNPDIAKSVYGLTGSYIHPIKGSQYKSFAEGY